MIRIQLIHLFVLIELIFGNEFTGCYRTYTGTNITSGPDPKYPNIFTSFRLEIINRQATCPVAGKNADPLGPCFPSPQEAWNDLKQYPEGQRTITLEGEGMYYIQSKTNKHIWLDTLPGGWYGPWADTWKGVMDMRFDKWFNEFHRIGGKVDMIVADFEVPDDLAVWRITTQKPHLGRERKGSESLVEAIASDPRWPTLRKELNEVGKQYKVKFDNISDIAQWTDSPFDYRTWVWGLVLVDQHTASWLNESVFQPISKYFPKVTMSNFAHSLHGNPQTTNGWWPWNYGVSGSPPCGVGAHVGTHQSHSIYGAPNNTQIFRTSYPGNVQEVAGNAFNALVLNIGVLQSMYNNGPTVHILPWLEPKQTNWGGASPWLADGNMWEENVLHAAVYTESKQYLWWKYSKDEPGNLSWDEQTALQLELDDLVKGGDGECCDHIPIVKNYSVISHWDVSFIMSGMQLAKPCNSKYAAIYRITFRDSTIHPHTTDPARFRLIGGWDIEPVPGGILYKPKKTVAPRGYWIVLRG